MPSTPLMGGLWTLCAEGFICCNLRTGYCPHYLFALSALSLCWPVRSAWHPSCPDRGAKYHYPTGKKEPRGPWSIGSVSRKETQTSSRWTGLGWSLEILLNSGRQRWVPNLIQYGDGVEEEISFCQIYYLYFSWQWHKGSWREELVVNESTVHYDRQSTTEFVAAGACSWGSSHLGRQGVLAFLSLFAFSPEHQPVGWDQPKSGLGLPSSVKLLW